MGIHFVKLRFQSDFYILPLYELILLLGKLYDSILKVIKLLNNDMLKVSISQFTIYHSHYKEKSRIMYLHTIFSILVNF